MIEVTLSLGKAEIYVSVPGRTSSDLSVLLDVLVSATKAAGGRATLTVPKKTTL